MKLNLKRFLAYLLTALMLVSVVPASAIAEITAASNTSASIRSIMPNEGVYVTFEFYAGEELVDTQIVKNGAGNVTEPKTPITEPGQKFVGWYVGNTPFIFGRVEGYTQSQTVRVEARYSDVYYVFFKDNTGRIVETKEGKTNDSIQTGDVTFPVRPTESITGWYTDKDCTPANKVESVTLGDANVTLYAKVEEGYWITYDSEGGSYIQPAFYTRGATAEAPKAPTRPGYTFDGWFTDAALTAPADFGSIKENTTVHAKWKAASTTYTVIHFWENADDDEYSYHESETKTGTTGAQTAAAAKSYPGFTAQTITQKTIAADGSTIVSVYYKRNVYQVKFFNRNGWNEYTDLRIEAKYGANISKKWPGGGWYVSTSGTTAQTNIDVMPLNGKNFYGKQSEGWDQTAYYYVEVLPGETGGTNVGGKYYKLDHTDTANYYGNLSVTKEDRYPITGFTCNTTWSAKNGDRYNGAKFYYDRNSYAINFISGGQPVNSQSVKYQASIAGYANYKPDKAPTGKEGYIFDGWYDNELCEGEPYAFTGKTMPAQNVTVYANWVAPVHTVTVYAADRTTVLKTITKVPHGGKIAEDAMPEVTPGEGEVFLGWVFEDGTPFSFNIEIKKDYAIYAKVGSTSKLGVTYKANAEGATGSVTDDNTYARGAFADVKPNGFTNEGKMFLYWNTRADGSGASYYPNASIKVEENVILYAIWGTPGAKVTLTYHSNFGEDAVKTTEPTLVNGQVAILSYSETNLPTREGYDFTGWTTSSNGEGLGFAEGDTARLDEEGENNLWAQWTAMDRKYTVEFYYETTDGGYELKKTETRTAKTDAQVAVTEEDKAETYEGKYVFDADNELNELEGTIPATGALVLKLYFKLNTAEYTIHHYLKGTEVKVADDQTGVETVGHTLTANKSSVLYEAYANAEVDSYSPEQTITIAATGNVITVYYTVPLTITAKDASKPYDGTPLIETGFTATGLVNGNTADKLALSMTAKSTITNVGTQPNVIDQTTVKYDGGAIPKYYTVAYEPGTLAITPVTDEVVVTIVGNTDTVTYDGTERKVEGYAVTIDNELYTENDFEFTGEAIAKGTNADTYPMGLNAEQFKNVSANFTNVRFDVTDGWLKIDPRKVTLTSGDGEKVYDGTALTNSEVTVSGDGFADGEGADYTVTGSQLNAGESENKFTYALKDGMVPTNYEITVEFGTLKVTPVTGEVVVTITGHEGTAQYDGAKHSVSGYDVAISNGLYTEDCFEFDGKAVAEGVHAGEYAMGLNEKQFKNVSTNFTNVKFVIGRDGRLAIEQRELIITAGSYEGDYDGEWHGVGYTAEGLAATDKITALTMKDDAILYPGELTASFLPETLKITHSDGTDSTGDYRVEYMPGKLVVNTVIVNYRVQYYYDGVLYGGATEEGTGEVLTKITEYRDKPRDMMFDHVDNFPLTLGLNEEENVIRVYYVHISLTGYLGAHNVGDCIE